MNDRLVWIDCEMTGLDLGTDALIEVAALVTDGELNVLGEGVDIIIAPPPAALEAMGDYVRTMHTTSGLLEQLATEVAALADELGRPLQLIAEWDRNDPRIVRPVAEGGDGFDAHWADDLHHALHATLTGERCSYYADFDGGKKETAGWKL